MKKFFLYILLFLLSSSIVVSIGISIPRERFYFFEPDLVITQGYQVVGSPSGVALRLYLAGDLINYTEILGRKNYRINEDEKKTFQIKITLPDELPMGPHRIKIHVREENPNTGGMSASASVSTELTVMVPYVGKYPVVQFKDASAKLGEPVKFDLSVQNLGDETIDYTSANIKIFEGDLVIDELKTSSATVKSKETKSINVIWFPPSDINPGIYSAKAEISLDDITKEVTARVKLGQEDIVVVDYPVELNAGMINEIPVNVKSIWNSRISDVDVSLELLASKGDEVPFQIIKSPAFDIQGWEEKIIPLYWNVPHSWKGDYYARLVISFSGKRKVEDIKLSILEKPSEDLTEKETNINKGVFRLFLMLMLVVLVVVNIAIYRYLKNKQEDEHIET